MKVQSTPKFLLAIAVLAAVAFAVWSGLDTRVESPVATPTPHGPFTAPF